MTDPGNTNQALLVLHEPSEGYFITNKGFIGTHKTKRRLLSCVVVKLYVAAHFLNRN